MVAGGYSVDTLLAGYPDLGPEDVIAALEYTAGIVDEDLVVAFDKTSPMRGCIRRAPTPASFACGFGRPRSKRSKRL
jgi:hypothetical protein